MQTFCIYHVCMIVIRYDYKNEIYYNDIIYLYFVQVIQCGGFPCVETDNKRKSPRVSNAIYLEKIQDTLSNTLIKKARINHGIFTFYINKRIN